MVTIGMETQVCTTSRAKKAKRIEKRITDFSKPHTMCWWKVSFEIMMLNFYQTLCCYASWSELDSKIKIEQTLKWGLSRESFSLPQTSLNEFLSSRFSQFRNEILWIFNPKYTFASIPQTCTQKKIALYKASSPSSPLSTIKMQYQSLNWNGFHSMSLPSVSTEGRQYEMLLIFVMFV